MFNLLDIFSSEANLSIHFPNHILPFTYPFLPLLYSFTSTSLPFTESLLPLHFPLNIPALVLPFTFLYYSFISNSLPCFFYIIYCNHTNLNTAYTIFGGMFCLYLKTASLLLDAIVHVKTKNYKKKLYVLPFLTNLQIFFKNIYTLQQLAQYFYYYKFDPPLSILYCKNKNNL